MKKLTVLTFLLLISASAFSEKAPHSPVRVLSTKSDIFYFKVDKDLIDATIEVYNEKGEKLISDSVKRRKTIIDFYNEEAGHFTIKIVKGNMEEQFDYVKKNVSPFIPIQVEPISITPL